MLISEAIEFIENNYDGNDAIKTALICMNETMSEYGDRDLLEEERRLKELIERKG